MLHDLFAHFVARSNQEGKHRPEFLVATQVSIDFKRQNVVIVVNAFAQENLIQLFREMSDVAGLSLVDDVLLRIQETRAGCENIPDFDFRHEQTQGDQVDEVVVNVMIGLFVQNVECENELGLLVALDQNAILQKSFDSVYVKGVFAGQSLVLAFDEQLDGGLAAGEFLHVQSSEDAERVANFETAGRDVLTAVDERD
jgi:hypothetical protein